MSDSPPPTISTSKCSEGMVVSRGPASMTESGRVTHLVIRGLDPRIHHLRKMDCRVKPGNDEIGLSIPIMIRLERAFRLDADVVGLVGPQLCQFDADLGQMQPRHL